MEQDRHDGGDELPTYDELAAQSGPNSRFGRWKGWVEKRAAERYAEDTPERRQARRLKGWGAHVDTQVPETPSPDLPLVASPASGLGRTQTVLSTSSPADGPELPPPASQITTGEALPPSHLKLHTFGSRFLPHSERPILSFLPLFDDEKLLIGHADGLTLLDMAPEEASSELNLKEPRRRDVWHGEGVYQMALLEHEQPLATGTPQGVVLALVGVEPLEGGSEKDSKEPFKAIRMYNLASLASIVRWAAVRKDTKPLDLSGPVNWQPVQTKKHRHLSMSRGLRSLKNDLSDPIHRHVQSSSSPLPPIPPPPPPKDPPASSPSSPENRQAPRHFESGDSEWEAVGHEDLPLRWATDYVPLASPNSRLANQSVLFFELHRSGDWGRVAARLAVATKQNILLYETMRGERAFRFVKEFYTPIPARGVTFVYQSAQDTPARARTGVPGSLSPTTYRGPWATVSGASSRRASSPVPPSSWSQAPPPPSSSSSSSPGGLSLFVVFEKKAGMIRILDSSVSELELWDGAGHAPRRSLDGPERGAWAAPAEVALAGAGAGAVYLLTRGAHTHVVRAPLRVPLAAHAPLHVLRWGMRPTRVVGRVLRGALLQVTALGADGVEAQEVPLAALGAAGAGVVAQADVGPGGAGFLCRGGHWTARGAGLQRQGSTSTVSTASTASTVGRARDEGIYAWTQKGYGDWRVFWLGGDAEAETP